MSLRQFLQKKERLHSRNGFAFLFSDGKYFSAGTLGVRYTLEPFENTPEWPLRMAIGVTKRKFKRANKRNLLKRRIKEAYRLHRLPLLQKLLQQNHLLTVFFTYRPTEPVPYQKIEQDMLRALKKLNELI